MKPQQFNDIMQEFSERMNCYSELMHDFDGNQQFCVPLHSALEVLQDCLKNHNLRIRDETTTI